MKLLVLGGTGTLGKPLVELLSKNNNFEVTVVSRNKHESYGNIKYAVANCHDITALEKILSSDKYDCIIDFMIYSLKEFSTIYQLFLNNTKQYFFLSSGRVYNNKNGFITESDLRLLDSSDDMIFKKSEDYALTKARQEDLLLNSKSNNYTIIRPYHTYSDHIFKLGIYEKEEWLYRVLNNKKILIQDGLLNKKTTLTYSGDVAGYIIELINNPKAMGQVFNIANDKMDLRWIDIINIYRKVLEKYNIELKYEITNKLFYNREYQLIYDRYCDRSFDCSKINSICNYRIQKSIEENIECCIDSFLKDRIFLNIDYKLEAYMDKELNERTQLKKINGYKNKIKYLLYRYTPYLKIKK